MKDVTMGTSPIRRVILSTMTVLLLVTVCQACPTCRDGIAEGAQQAGIIRGYFWSILFMMSMPFLILGGLSAYFYYQIRQAHASRVSQPLVVTETETTVTGASHAGR
jgi:hypothetical protein